MDRGLGIAPPAMGRRVHRRVHGRARFLLGGHGRDGMFLHHPRGGTAGNGIYAQRGVCMDFWVSC